MFQKSTFGNTTSGFGSFNTAASTSSPFGGFKPQAGTSAFGAAPAFGATAATQPAQTGSFFGASNTGGGLFGSTAPASTPSTFGASTSGGFGFGAQNTSTGLFGAQNTNTGLFGGNQTQANTGFGAKPPGFGFGATPVAPTTGGGLFGASPSTSLFGQQPAPMAGSTLFSNTGGFGQQSTQTGTAHVKYNPVVGTDIMVKSGNSQNINIKHHCITFMKEYENKSLEELRLEDYMAGNKGAAAAPAGGLFGAAKPLFGATSAFGQPATTSAGGGVFGSTGLSTGFGQPAIAQNNTFAFGGGTAQTNTTGLFGANKPAFGATATPGTTNLFGATTTQAPAFGTNTSTFGFGANTQNQGGGLFNNKPTTGFGATTSTTGFGFGGGGLFNKPAQPTSSAPTPFGSTTPAFGTTTSSAGGLFNNTFKPPAQTSFGFGANTQTNTGLGTLGSGLGTSFASKPAGGGFPSLNTTGSNLFNTQTAPTLNFNTGNTTLGSGMGAGLGFGNTSLNSSLGSLGTTGTMGTLGSATVGASAGCNVHEQILNLAARPYGDWPLFKDLPDTSTTAEDILKPTQPAAIASALARSGYRVADSALNNIKLRPNLYDHKKSLFDGLEESDASLEDKLSLKPSRKRLVLRPQRSRVDVQNNLVENNNNNNNRSLEDSTQREKNAINRSIELNNSANASRDAPKLNNSNADERARQPAEYGDNIRGVNTDLEDSSERHSSWLGSSKLPWDDSKEKPVDNQLTPRLYPDLGRELEPSERRASWLTTKPLHMKPLPDHQPQDSVRELITERIPYDKENIDLATLSEDENVAPRDAPPHPTGVKLTRPGYYTVPSLDDMISYIRPDGRCVVPHLTIGRRNYGNVYYDCEIDVTGLDLDNLVHFLNKEVIIYPSDVDKPPVGSGLNQRAIVTLDRVWPRDKTERRPVTDPDRLQKMEYEAKLRRVCDKHDTKFIEYRPQTGSWVFRVEHFSKYGLTDSDEEDDITPDVLKRQLVNQSLQKNAAPAQKQLSTPLPVGLGGLMAPEDNIFAMQQSSLNLLSNAGKAFVMDTTEDNNNTESQSMYPEHDRAEYLVKSPTSELARLENRQSHHVQLMKASLYADTEMYDDKMSTSTGDQDQLVPTPAPPLSVNTLLATTTTTTREDEHEPALVHAVHNITDVSEIQMKPLHVQPHTIVLKYHRKVPPFKQTIAGKMDASCIADMSICRSRHSRVGFGPAARLVHVTTARTAANVASIAVNSVCEISELGRVMSGRSEEDWSECVVSRLALGATHRAHNVEEQWSGHLEALLEYSSLSEVNERLMPRLVVKESPRDRRSLLDRHLKEALANERRNATFGITDSYCYQVWSLCEALWGADLDNDGIPGTDELSVVNRHKALLQWLTAATADITDKELKTPHTGDDDECSGASVRVLSLLNGGRVAAACRAARANCDYNMAAVLAQAPGDATVRSLISRQLQSWRASGAMGGAAGEGEEEEEEGEKEETEGGGLIDRRRAEALAVLSGTRPQGVNWLTLLHVTARYLCPQVPTLEQIITKFESFYRRPGGDGDDEVDLTVIDDEPTDLEYPLPPYQTDYEIIVQTGGRRRRVLDLRYELMRARALHARPRPAPAQHTASPLHHALCFLLGAWFGSPSVDAVTGTAVELEAAGAWHLAVLALAYHPDDVARTHLVNGVLSRHLPAEVTAGLEPRMALLKRLRVPTRLIHIAQAHRAKYQHEPRLEAEHLLSAGMYNAAHKVLLDELLPATVLADEVESIRSILERLNEAAQRDEVSGWEKGGQALYHYLHVCSEIRSVVESERPCGRREGEGEGEGEREREREIEGAMRVEALRPRVAAAARALAAYTPKSAAGAAARAEMGARLVQTAAAGAGAGAGTGPGEGRVAPLARLLRDLRLPPDCTTRALHQMTTELSERASEECSGGSLFPHLQQSQA